MDHDLRSLFHPLLAEWFAGRYAHPTEAQAGAWPLIAAGENVLVIAPTGTGKTYSAFLYALNQLIAAEWETGAVRVLYVSPLKALGSDIRENLLGPLGELQELSRAKNLAMPNIRVQTRSGDTPEADRRRMLRSPPEILITTPESLNLIISSPNARLLLQGVKTVIVDEIHSVIDSKRGTHLITAVDRLVLLAGEFQRIGLSATVRSPEIAAAFLGGYRGRGAGRGWSYEPRPVRIVRATRSKSIVLNVRYPVGGNREGSSFWQLLGAELREIILARRSTLIFVNSRRLAERITHEINEGQEEIIAYPHHGSLSRELRSVVESRMKRGELRAIVATGSLELGIDIGALEEVLLVETPMSVAASVQRIGRAGHSVGAVSTGTLFASHGMDLLRAAVASRMVADQDIEETRPVLCPLDVLAQIIISMTSLAPWKIDDLYGFLLSSFPYHTLSRRQFDLVVAMLEGSFEETRIRELAPRVVVDRIDGIIKARDGARYLLYSGGGTIPDRGYYGLHVRDSGAKIGELDEEFVWERRIGDAFVLGSQRWKIVAIDHQRVSVIPWKGSVNSSPFWKAERMLRSFHFSEKIGQALEAWDHAFAAGLSIAASPSRATGSGPGAAEADLACMDEAARSELEGFLALQRSRARAPLPHRHHLLAEHTGGRGSARFLLLHTLWGGRVNEPLALALSALLRRDFQPLDVGADNDTIVVTLPDGLPGEVGRGEVSAGELLATLSREDIHDLIQEELESSGYFGARFRENAGRALLLPRHRSGRRIPLWVTRLRAKRLLERVRRYADFPIVAETWRGCIRDEFDLASLSRLLEEVRAGEISISEIATAAPSPFASGIVWLQTNQYFYGDDTPEAGRGPAGGSLTSELLREMVFTPELRVRIPRDLAASFEAKLERTEAGYAPTERLAVIAWLKERLLIPLEEWRELLASCERDGGPSPAEMEAACADRTIGILPVGGRPFIAPIELRSRLERGLVRFEPAGAFAEFLKGWLASRGPVPVERLAVSLGVGTSGSRLTRERFEGAIEELCDEGVVVRGELLEGSTEPELCDAENLERLLSFIRRRSAVTVETRPFDHLVPFLAQWQGLEGLAGGQGATAGSDETGEARLPSLLERLFGFPARVALWESDILPARQGIYRRHWLDRLLSATELEWFGCGRQALSFRFQSDAELFDSPSRSAGTAAEGAAATAGDAAGENTPVLFAEPAGHYTYWDLQARSGLAPHEFTGYLWGEVWKGRLSSDSFEAVRRGATNGFRSEEPKATPYGGRRRSAFAKWKARTPLSGTWYLPAPNPSEAKDSLDELEDSKDRVRLLLDRYGVLFRELLERELPAFRWSRIFRTLRLLELSGEILSGRFFGSIPGLQFAEPQAVMRLSELSFGEEVYWMNATDPASPCGLGIPGEAGWPARLPSTHLVFHATRLVLVSKRFGRDLTVETPPESSDLGRYLGIFDRLLTRDYEPLKAVRVETINGLPARESPYRLALVDFGFEEDFKNFTYRGRRTP